MKRYRASAIAARNAITIEIATVTETTIRLFNTSRQKKGRLSASRKCCSVGWSGNQVGVSAVDLVVRLERRRDHPEDREDHHDEHGEPDGVPPRLADAAAVVAATAHCAVPIRTILRT